MGKWSLIDVYVLILCQCAFRVSVKSPIHGLEVIPQDFYDAEVMVLPVWGMFAFLFILAPTVSITGHREMPPLMCFLWTAQEVFFCPLKSSSGNTS